MSEPVSEITGQIESNHETYRMVLRSDGTASLFEGEWESDKFSHDLDLVALQQTYPDAEARQEYLSEWFWQNINHRLDDPFLVGYDELNSYELTFVSGKAGEFERLMGLFLLTEPNLDKARENEVVVNCATNDGPAQLGRAQWYYSSDRLEKLVKLALAEHHPFGYTYEYNDQRGDRRSGYSLNPAQLEYDLNEIAQSPARERMNARRELREWLTARGHDPASYDLQEWEKIV